MVKTPILCTGRQCGAEARTTAGLYDHLFTIDTAILKANFTKDMQDYAREQIKASTGKDIDRLKVIHLYIYNVFHSTSDLFFRVRYKASI